jgi:hypothetical protein
MNFDPKKNNDIMQCVKHNFLLVPPRIEKQIFEYF